MLAALDRIEADVDKLVDESPWLGVGRIQQLHDSLTTLRMAAQDRVDPADFGDIAATTAALVRDTFGALET